MLHTLGGLLKKYRTTKLNGKGKPMSQMEVSSAVGWENPSTYSRIESGQVLPTRNTLIKIAQALSLKKIDIDKLLAIAGFANFDIPMTEEYINEMIDSVREDLEGYNYPVIMQIGIEGIYWNTVWERFFFSHLIEDNKSRVRYQNASITDILFDEEFQIRPNIINWEYTAKVTVSNLYNMSLAWPSNTALQKQCNTWHNKYSDFRKHWDSVQTKFPFGYKKYLNIEFIYKRTELGILNFTVTTVYWIFDRRFVIEHVVPTTQEDNKKLLHFLRRFV